VNDLEKKMTTLWIEDENSTIYRLGG